MWILSETYISDTGLKWNAIGVFYLLLTANAVIIMENYKRHQNSKKMLEYGVIELINMGYLILFVWSSDRIRYILYDFLTKTIGEGSAWKL